MTAARTASSRSTTRRSASVSELDFNDPDSGADVSVEVRDGQHFLPAGPQLPHGRQGRLRLQRLGRDGDAARGGSRVRRSYWIFAIDDNRIRLATSQLDEDGNIVVSFTTVTSPTEIQVGSSARPRRTRRGVQRARDGDFKNTLIDIDTESDGQLARTAMARSSSTARGTRSMRRATDGRRATP